MSETCILIPTFKKYRWLAQFTESILDEYWESHPEIYFCGIANGENNNWLPLKSDPADWVGIVEDACALLLKKGYTKCYLILDDHPPLAKCHETHLNETIPALMDKVGAAYIGLHGWGQRKHSADGVILDRERYFLERVSENYLWKFSLHPGIWNLDIMQGILQQLMKKDDPKSRSPWAFERFTGASDFDISHEWKTSSYRIDGYAMTNSLTRRIIRSIELLVCDGARFLTGRTAGIKARKSIETLTECFYHYYEGPYPLMWRGVMNKGEENQEMVLYLRTHGKTGFLKKLKGASRS